MHVHSGFADSETLFEDFETIAAGYSTFVALCEAFPIRTLHCGTNSKTGLAPDCLSYG